MSPYRAQVRINQQQEPRKPVAPLQTSLLISPFSLIFLIRRAQNRIKLRITPLRSCQQDQSQRRNRTRGRFSPSAKSLCSPVPLLLPPTLLRCFFWKHLQHGRDGQRGDRRETGHQRAEEAHQGAGEGKVSTRFAWKPNTDRSVMNSGTFFFLLELQMWIWLKSNG